MLAILSVALVARGETGPGAVDFARDIKPLLSDRCFACHGPDEESREGELRLDVREAAVDWAIVPGEPGESAVIERIESKDPDLKMPPADSHKKPLTDAEIALVRRWVQDGAPYQLHWAYVPPTRPDVPAVKNKSWPLNPIDQFIAARQEEHGLNPAEEADRRTLIRRLYVDLLGLPAKPNEVDAFLKDKSPQAYQRLVDRLLASPHFGERMAVYWLDVVRYADSGGYHSDNERQVWMYRDYVIDAFNQNIPFDRFVVEQIAGDLMPEATQRQKIASGYNRLLQTTEEGGSQPKEYTAKYAADRTRNTATAFLGATLGCAECHDHKYDPYKMRDFYSFAAFFADVKERAVGRQEQTKLPTDKQLAEMKSLDEQLAAVRKVLATQTPQLDAALAKWETELKQKPELAKGVPKNIIDILAIEPGKRNDGQKKALADHFRTTTPQLESQRKRLAELDGRRKQLDAQIPSTLITMAVSPRTVRLLPRGNWLDDSGEIMQPAVPVFLTSLDVGDRRATRLDLAQWIASPGNPLTARVFVNRLWMLMFGHGLVRSPDDFGSQGQLPTHPKLLDWLAAEFVESGWDVKHVVKLMVSSRAYQQSSRASAELRRKDPTNQWLARQNRFRMEGEFVRDNALAISGLLVDKIGGRSVKPYQPVGYWKHLNFPKRSWKHDEGESQYRRGLYTHWQRTFLHPSLLAFDVPSREDCVVKRARSNTPLQALVLLNDPTYVEAARALAVRMVREGGGSIDDRIKFAFREALSREPNAKESELLRGLHEKHKQQYASDAEAAGQCLSVGLYQTPQDIEASELAALTSVARTVLNLHENITRY
jgi:hypothetical protein